MKRATLWSLNNWISLDVLIIPFFLSLHLFYSHLRKWISNCDFSTFSSHLTDVWEEWSICKLDFKTLTELEAWANTPRGLVIFCYCARCLEWTWVRMSREAIFSEFWSFWIAECWRLNTCSSLDVFIMALYLFHPHWFSLHSIGMSLMLRSVNLLQMGLQNPFRTEGMSF